MAARCPVCYLPTEHCMCSAIEAWDNQCRIVIVRHQMEVHKNSNSGRLAALGLTNAQLLTFGAPTELDEAVIARPGSCLLFPTSEPTPVPSPPPTQLVVLDATWHQARRMRQRISALRGMPIISLAAPAQPAERLRRSPGPEHMSTAEAISAALELVGERNAANHLRNLLAIFVNRSRLGARHRYRGMPRD